MEIIEWESGINRIISNESVPAYGENALNSNKSENGADMTSLKNSDAPDVWTVVMYFSNSVDDSFYANHTIGGKHVTEWEAFINWFKYKLCFGTKSFYFNKIGTENKTAIYRMQSSGLPKPQIIGTTMKASMTWIEYNPVAITVIEPVVSGDYLDVTNGIMDFHFNEKPEDFPQKDDFTAYYQNYDNNGDLIAATYSIPIERIIYDGNKTVQMYFQEIDEPDGERIRVSVVYEHEQGEASTVYADLIIVNPAE